MQIYSSAKPKPIATGRNWVRSMRDEPYSDRGLGALACARTVSPLLF